MKGHTWQLYFILIKLGNICWCVEQTFELDWYRPAKLLLTDGLILSFAKIKQAQLQSIKPDRQNSLKKTVAQHDRDILRDLYSQVSNQTILLVSMLPP